MNGFTDLRLQVAHDQIRRLHADAASARLARHSLAPHVEGGPRRSFGSVFGRSLRAIGLAH